MIKTVRALLKNQRGSPLWAIAAVGIRLSFEPATLDWNKGDVPIHVINNVMEGLYAVSADGKTVPCEAEGQPAPSGKGRFRIRLRANLKWSDGTPVTARDYAASWKRLKDPATASTYTSLIKGLVSAKAKDDRTIELVMHGSERPDPSVFTHWVTFPVREDLIAKAGQAWGSDPRKMAFNGPYQIKSYRHDVKLELVPNPHHRNPGTLARIEALIVPDDSTALRLYEAGTLHFLSDLGTLDRAALSKRADYHRAVSPVLVYLGVDTAFPGFSSAEKRKRLSAAIHRENIPKILNSSDLPARSFLPPDLAKSEGITPPPANAIPDMGARNAVPVVFAYYEKGSNRLLCEYLQAEIRKNLGWNTALRPVEVKTYWSRLANRPFPLFLNSFGPPAWDARFYLELFSSGNPMNMGRWKNTGYDEALGKKDFRKALAILEDELPAVPLYFRSYEYLMSPKLKGATLNPMTSLFLDRADLR